MNFPLKTALDAFHNFNISLYSFSCKYFLIFPITYFLIHKSISNNLGVFKKYHCYCPLISNFNSTVIKNILYMILKCLPH